jgi:hypothetical protein
VTYDRIMYSVPAEQPAGKLLAVDAREHGHGVWLCCLVVDFGPKDGPADRWVDIADGVHVVDPGMAAQCWWVDAPTASTHPEAVAEPTLLRQAVEAALRNEEGPRHPLADAVRDALDDLQRQRDDARAELADARQRYAWADAPNANGRGVLR